MSKFKEGDWVRTISGKSSPFLITKETLLKQEVINNLGKDAPIGGFWESELELCAKPRLIEGKWYSLKIKKYSIPVIGRVDTIRSGRVLLRPFIVVGKCNEYTTFDLINIESQTELKVEDPLIQNTLPLKSSYKIKPIGEAVHCKSQEEWDFVVSKIKINQFQEFYGINNCICVSNPDITFTGHNFKKQWYIDNYYKITEFEDWCTTYKYGGEYVSFIEKNLIKEAKQRGFVKGAKFIDLVNKVEFTVRHDLNFNNTSNSKGRLYIPVEKVKGMPNLTARIYQNGEWAQLAPPIRYYPDSDEWKWEIPSNCSSGLRIGEPKIISEWSEDSEFNLGCKDMSRNVLISMPTSKKNLIKDFAETDFNRKLVVENKQHPKKVKLLL